MLDNTKEFWSQTWDNYFQEYIKTIPRQAYYLYFVSSRRDKKIIEIAAGTFRDMVKLNYFGFDCSGIDFSSKVVEKAKQLFPLYADKIFTMDAECTSFNDHTFDISFHNGFFICFNDNDKLRKLIKEQCRISRRMVVLTVHNRLNQNLVRIFNQKAVQDKLYDIRFFYDKELIQLLEPFCRKIKIFPFGLPFFDTLIQRIKKPWLLKKLYRLSYRCWNLAKCERIMVVGYL